MSKKLITESIVQHSTVLESLDQDTIGKAAQLIVESIHNNNKIFWCGNGGSASQANHLSAELVGGMYQEKTKPCQSICLNVDTAFITAWSNDDSFDNIFVRQLEALSNNGDILVVLSTSGNSSNIVNATKFAQSNNLKVISLTGNDGGDVKNSSDINININSDNTQRIQEMHILVGHIICEIAEQSL